MGDDQNIHVWVDDDGANVSVIFDDEEVPYLLVSGLGAPPRVRVHRGVAETLDFGRTLKVRLAPQVKRLFVRPHYLERILLSSEFIPAVRCKDVEPGQLGEFQGQKVFVALDGEE